MKLKIAVFAPMPKPSESTTITVNPGWVVRFRHATRRSRHTLPMNNDRLKCVFKDLMPAALALPVILRSVCGRSRNNERQECQYASIFGQRRRSRGCLNRCPDTNSAVTIVVILPDTGDRYITTALFERQE